MENFGVILKDQSINMIPQIADKFQDCFVVNYHEKELQTFAKWLKGKNITQFVNRRGTIRMPHHIYEEFNIKKIQYNMPEYIEGWFRKQRIPRVPTIQVDKKTQKRKREYEEYGLEFMWLPEKVTLWQKFFEPIEDYPGEYMWKHPNTGVQACIMAAHKIKPKHLWIAGLGFYQVGYLYRRSVCNPQEKQKAKMKRCKMIEHFEQILDHYTDVQWHICTTYPDFKPRDHVEIMLYKKEA